MATKRKRAKRKNPAKKRRHKRNPSAAPKRRRARRANPKRRHARRNPVRRRRARRANPKRRHRRNPARSYRRTSRRNPSRKRRHRRNPGIPSWAMALLAGGAGLVTYAVGQAGSFAIAQRVGQNREHLDKLRYGAFGVATLAGIAVAIWASPIIGAGIAAGGLMGLGGTELSLALGRVVDKTEGPPAKLAAVYGAGGNQRFGAVYDPSGVQRLTGGGNMGATFNAGGQQSFGSSYDDYQSFGG